MAAPRTLCLVKQRKLLYPESLHDYELLRELGTPFYTLEADYVPSLSARAHRNKVRVEVTAFEDIRRSMLDLIHNSWEFGFEEFATGSFKLVVPNTRKARARAQKLVDALRSFYRRHLSTLDIQVRKGQKATTLRFTATFDKERNPEWLSYSRSS